MVGSLENEKAILQQTADEVEILGDQLAGAPTDRAKDAQAQFDRKMDIYWRQISAFKSHFPDKPDAAIYEASFYGFQALGKFHSVSFMRKATKTVLNGAGKAVNSGPGGLAGAVIGLTGGVVGGTLALGTSMIAKQHEKANAREALALLDKAIGMIDLAVPHLVKAQIHLALDEKSEAVKELDWIISRFPNDTAYRTARQLKDEALTPKKKNWLGF